MPAARRRFSIAGPLVLWELVRLARAGSQLRWRLGLSIALLAMTYLLYVNRFPRADLLQLSFESVEASSPRDVASFTEYFVRSFMYLELFVVIVLTPILVVGGITDEVQRRTMTYLLTTDLTNWEILGGKTLGRLIHLAGVLATGLPVVGLMQFFGGVDGRVILASSLVLFGTALSLGGISLWLAVVHRAFWPAAWRAYGIALAACVGLSVFVCCNPVGGIMSPPIGLYASFGEVKVDDRVVDPIAVGVAFLIIHAATGLTLIVASIRRFRKPVMARGRAPIEFRSVIETAPPISSPIDRWVPTRQPLVPRAPIVLQAGPPPELVEDEQELLDPLVYDEAGIVAAALPSFPVASSKLGGGPPNKVGATVDQRPEISRRPYRHCPADADPLLWKEITFAIRRDTQANVQDLSRVAWAIMGVVAVLFLSIAVCALGGNNNKGDLAESGAGGMMRFAAAMAWLGTLVAAALKGVHLFAVERQRQTLETLLSIPVERAEIVWAKFRAALWNLWWPGGLAALMLGAWILLAGNLLQLLVAVVGVISSCVLAAAIGLRVGLTARNSMRGLLGALAVLAIFVLGPLPLGLAGQVTADQFLSSRPGVYPVSDTVDTFSPLGVWRAATAPSAGEWRNSSMWVSVFASLLVCAAMLAAAWGFYRSARNRLGRDEIGVKIV